MKPFLQKGPNYLLTTQMNSYKCEEKKSSLVQKKSQDLTEVQDYPDKKSQYFLDLKNTLHEYRASYC